MISFFEKINPAGFAAAVLSLIFFLDSAGVILSASDENTLPSETISSFTNTQDASKIISKDSYVSGPSPQSTLIHYFPDIKKIVERGSLNIGVNTFSSNEPFIIKEKDSLSYRGLDIEMAEDFCRCIGVKPLFNYSATNIRELFLLLSTGEVDIAVGDLNRSFERMKYVYFSEAYATLYQSVIMNNSDLIKHSISENPFPYLQKNTVNIGVEAETAYVDFALLNFPKATIIKYPPGNTGEIELNERKIFAAFGDSNEMLILARKYPEVALKFTIFVFTDLKITKGIAISPINPNLVNLVNSYILMHNIDYELEDLLEKYPEVYKD